MVCAPVQRDNPRALARGLSTLHSTEYLLLKIGYLWNVVQGIFCGDRDRI